MQQRVLLAEDEPNIVESLRFLLTRAGFAVEVRETGPSALEAAQVLAPDVLVLDVMLPEMNGFDVLTKLRADRNTADMPVLMLTAKGQREDRERAIELGANQFMSKPFGNAELVEAVRELARLEASPVALGVSTLELRTKNA